MSSDGAQWDINSTLSSVLPKSVTTAEICGLNVDLTKVSEAVVVVP